MQIPSHSCERFSSPRTPTTKLCWWGPAQSFLISQLLGICSWRWGPEGPWLSSRLCTEEAWPPGLPQSFFFYSLRTITQPAHTCWQGPACQPHSGCHERYKGEQRRLCVSQLRLSSQMPQPGDINHVYFLFFLEVRDQVSAGLVPFMDLQPSCPVSISLHNPHPPFVEISKASYLCRPLFFWSLKLRWLLRRHLRPQPP